MKKVLIAILALLYISTNVGATVQMHYCMGKLADWGVEYKESTTCSKCGMEKGDKNDNGCCKDEHKFIKNDTDQKITEAGLQLFHTLPLALPISFIDIPSTGFSSIIEENPIGHSPPQSSGAAVYIRNCVFLI